MAKKHEQRGELHANKSGVGGTPHLPVPAEVLAAVRETVEGCLRDGSVRAASRADFVGYRAVEAEFGIKRSALYRLRKRNLVGWSKPPGCSYLFSRASIRKLLHDNGQQPLAVTQPVPKAAARRARKASPTPAGLVFRFLK